MYKSTFVRITATLGLAMLAISLLTGIGLAWLFASTGEAAIYLIAFGQLYTVVGLFVLVALAEYVPTMGNSIIEEMTVYQYLSILGRIARYMLFWPLAVLHYFTSERVPITDSSVEK